MSLHLNLDGLKLPARGRYSLKMSDEERAIRELIRLWMDAAAKGDLATILGLMSDDALFMTPGREPFGKEEFASAFAAMKNVQIAGRSTIKEIEIFGNFAWVRNQIELKISTGEDASVRRSGYALTIFRKEPDGNWRLFRDANLVS